MNNYSIISDLINQLKSNLINWNEKISIEENFYNSDFQEEIEEKSIKIKALFCVINKQIQKSILL
jgi:hypothetical protein